MAITTTLAGFPAINQLSAPTTDGLADENARMNCVAASLAAALDYLLPGRTFEPDQLKDTIYGQGYTGFQAAQAYVAYCAGLGVTLHAVYSSQAGLISVIRNELLAGHPVIVTMPSQWATAPADPVHPSGYTHVGVMCGYGASELRCMNPWGGFWQDESDAWWQARLCDGAVWPLYKGAPVSYTRQPNGWWKDDLTGEQIGDGLHAYTLSHALPECIGGETTAPNGRDSYALFGDHTGATCIDRVVYWDASHGAAVEGWAAHVILGLRAELAAAKSAQAAGAATSDPEAASALATLKALKTTLAGL